MKAWLAQQKTLAQLKGKLAQHGWGLVNLHAHRRPGPDAPPPDHPRLLAQAELCL